MKIKVKDFYGMTGFGSGKVENTRLSVRIELRSWNSKGLDVYVKGPFLLIEWEAVLREQILNSGVRRGLVRADVFFKPKNIGYKVAINRGLWKELKNVSSDLKLKTDFSLVDLLNVSGLFFYELADPSDALPSLKRALRIALKQLIAQRAQEGHVMCKAILDRLQVIIETYDCIKERINRLEREGLFKEKVNENGYREKDVYEEIKRLEMNINMFKKTITSSGPKGKRLDFIAQELLREANTFMAKIVDAELTRLALDLKTAVDRIREVVQNVE